MLNLTRPRRKFSILALTLGGLVLLAGCSGKTTGTTEITHVSAKLHATGRCDAGQTCTWYWEYWPANGPRYFDSYQLSKKTPVQGPMRGASADVPLSTVITGLQPNTTYRWVFCGSPNNGADYACVGPDGKGGSTTADPPPDFETFTTPPFEALAESWDGTSWAIRTTPNPTDARGDSDLSGTSCTSATTCTAVGSYSAGRDVTLAQRWNGTGWTVQSTPNPTGADSSYLEDVSCTSATACTAVGRSTSYVGTSGKQVTLAERWDGTAWTIQPTPEFAGPYGSSLEGISCTSATACTAVGYSVSDGKLVTLAERWNGTDWTVQSTPNPTGARGSRLQGVSCTSATACTAVGSYYKSDGKPVTLAERWNGTSWKVQSTPNPTGGQHNSLQGISCTSATACTAAGKYFNSAGNWATLAERWNGTAWTVQSTPNPPGAGDGGSYFEGVSCTSATACTAVGYSDQDTRLPPVTLAERWNGTAWTVQSTPNPTGGQSLLRRLSGVSCTTATTCTAVGHK